MPKNDVPPTRNEVRKYLYDKVEEWLDSPDRPLEGETRTLQEAEENFKNWLWGTGHVGR